MMLALNRDRTLRCNRDAARAADFNVTLGGSGARRRDARSAIRSCGASRRSKMPQATEYLYFAPTGKAVRVRRRSINGNVSSIRILPAPQMDAEGSLPVGPRASRFPDRPRSLRHCTAKRSQQPCARRRAATCRIPDRAARFTRSPTRAAKSTRWTFGCRTTPSRNCREPLSRRCHTGATPADAIVVKAATEGQTATASSVRSLSVNIVRSGGGLLETGRSRHCDRVQRACRSEGRRHVHRRRREAHVFLRCARVFRTPLAT